MKMKSNERTKTEENRKTHGRQSGRSTSAQLVQQWVGLTIDMFLEKCLQNIRYSFAFIQVEAGRVNWKQINVLCPGPIWGVGIRK